MNVTFSSDNLVFQARIPCAPCSYGVQCNNVVCIQKVNPLDVFSMIKENIKFGNWRVPENLTANNDIRIPLSWLYFRIAKIAYGQAIAPIRVMPSKRKFKINE